MKRLVMIAALALFGCDNTETATAQARAYLRENYPTAQHRTATCMAHDTDNNGYVSCDATVDGRPVLLECAANAGCLFACNHGCKLRPMVQIQQQVSQ